MGWKNRWLSSMGPHIIWTKAPRIQPRCGRHQKASSFSKDGQAIRLTWIRSKICGVNQAFAAGRMHDFDQGDQKNRLKRLATGHTRVPGISLPHYDLTNQKRPQIEWNESEIRRSHEWMNEWAEWAKRAWRSERPRERSAAERMSEWMSGPF